MKMDCHGLTLSYFGHGFCHKFIALSLHCTVTFVDKEKGPPSTGFCYAKNNSGAFGAECVWESCWQAGAPSSSPDPALPRSAPMRACPRDR